MCIAVPMEVLEIDEPARTGKVLYSGNEMDVNLTLVSPKVGDYVLVHAGCAIEIMQKEPAEEMLDILKILEESAHEP
ncbi:MAG: HypC/HybG/HupF family hydrogenase formation chaperone [Oscillospiraceae bacterium]|nr:HypC/HybG/HupF family hydrogenase formation chaperone [Oscillospiraceae bacterium]